MTVGCIHLLCSSSWNCQKLAAQQLSSSCLTRRPLTLLQLICGGCRGGPALYPSDHGNRHRLSPKSSVRRKTVTPFKTKICASQIHAGLWFISLHDKKAMDRQIVHRKISFDNPVPSRGMSLTGNNLYMTSLFPPRESLVSDIPAGDGKSKSFFYGVRSIRVSLNYFIFRFQKPVGVQAWAGVLDATRQVLLSLIIN
jgi:hypothetical protein